MTRNNRTLRIGSAIGAGALVVGMLTVGAAVADSGSTDGVAVKVKKPMKSREGRVAGDLKKPMKSREGRVAGDLKKPMKSREGRVAVDLKKPMKSREG
jgi:hypothetical protein